MCVCVCVREGGGGHAKNIGPEGGPKTSPPPPRKKRKQRLKEGGRSLCYNIITGNMLVVDTETAAEF